MIFFFFITPLSCALLSLQVIYYVIEILLTERECEREGMEITNGKWERNGNETKLNMGLRIRMEMNRWECEGNGNKTRLNLGLRIRMGMNH